MKFHSQLDESLNDFVIGSSIEPDVAVNETVDTHNNDFVKQLQAYNAW